MRDTVVSNARDMRPHRVRFLHLLPPVRVLVRVMGDGGQLTGHVESIAARIEDRDRAEGSNLLANVNPTFYWVRLAQRVPARIALDPTPDPARLVAGRRRR